MPVTSRPEPETGRPAWKTAAGISVLAALLSLPFFALQGAPGAVRSDEVWSLKTAALPYSQIMAAIRADVHPPLYYLLLGGWLRLAGEEAWTARLLSALLYVLNVFLVYGLARRLLDFRGSVLCAVLYMTSPLALLSAEFVRMYALLSLFSILSTRFYLEFSLRPEGSRRGLAGYVVASALGTFTHVWFFFLLFGQVLCQLVLFRAARAKRFAAALGLALMPYAALWLPTLLEQVRRSREATAWLEPPGIAEFGRTLLMQGGGFWLLLPALAYGLWQRRRSPAAGEPGGAWSRRAAAFAGLLLAASLAAPVLVSQFKPVFYSRFTIIVLHLFALAAAAVFGGISKHRLPIALLVIAWACIGYSLLQPPSCSSRWTAAHLLEHARETDYVIFTSLSRQPVDYYLERAGQRPGFRETSFPREIDAHPGYEGRIHEPAAVARLRQEAESLVAEIRLAARRNRDLKVFLLHGFRPQTDAILKELLDKELEPLPGESVRCAARRNYFDQVSVYRGARGGAGPR